MMNDGMMIRQNKDGVWEEYEPYATIAVDTEEDYKFLLNAVELAKKMKWIPVTERLPEKPLNGWEAYLVQDAYVCDPYTAYWKGDVWEDEDDRVLLDIIAWMPLPEPYKEG